MDLKEGTYLWLLFLRAYVSDRGWINWLVWLFRVPRHELPELKMMDSIRGEFSEGMSTEERALWRERYEAAQLAFSHAENRLVKETYAAAAEQNLQLALTGNLCPTFRKMAAALLIYQFLFVPLRWALRNFVARPIAFSVRCLMVALHYLVVVPAQFLDTLISDHFNRIGAGLILTMVFCASLGLGTVFVNSYDNITTWLSELPMDWTNYWTEYSERSAREEAYQKELEGQRLLAEARRITEEAKERAERPAREARERREAAARQRWWEQEKARRAAAQAQWNAEHPEEVARAAEERRLEQEADARYKALALARQQEDDRKFRNEMLRYVGLPMLILAIFVLLVFNVSHVSYALVLLMALPFVYFDGKGGRWDRFWAKVDAFLKACTQIRQLLRTKAKAAHDGICPPNHTTCSPEEEARVRATIAAIRRGDEVPQL